MINPLTDMYRKYVESTTNVPITSSMLETLYEEEIPEVQPTIPTEVQPTIPTEVQPTITAQEGGPIENAETDLETRVGPMGVINDRAGDPGPSLGGEGISDDLTMEVPEGSYILNADAVSLIGISDINEVIRDAYTIAAALGQELPADYDPQNKVPIRISNGEAIIPAPLVGVIGLDRLERWNTKGLEIRRQKEEVEKAQAEAQAAQPVTEAPPVQPQSPMQAQMGGLMGYNEGDEVKEDSLIHSIFEKFLEDLGFGSELGDIQNDINHAAIKLWNKVDRDLGEYQKVLKKTMEDIVGKQDGGTIQSFKEGGVLNWIERQLGEALEEKDDPFKVTKNFRSKLDSWMNEYNKKTNQKLPLNINNALALAETIAMQESDSGPYERQDLTTIKSLKNLWREGTPYGPGRGLYQYEMEGSNTKTQEAAKSAITRARAFDPSISWLSKFDNDNDEDYDVRKLTGREQTELFIIDHLLGKHDPFIDTVNNANLTGEQAFEYWLDHHKRKGSVTKKRRQEFIDNYNRNKSKLYSN